MTASAFQHLDIATLERWLDEAAPLTLVDIRDSGNFSAGHIPGSSHLDNDSVAALMQQAPTEQPMVVICYHGHSSMQAAAWLASQGYAEVYSLDGGFSEWQQRCPARVTTA